jgi:DNA invertase Pin-like site-specific DNA recombinase
MIHLAGRAYGEDMSVISIEPRDENVSIRLSERTKAGLDRARKQGKVLGRPRAAVDAAEIRELRAQGLSWGAISRNTGLARATCQKAAL